MVEYWFLLPMLKLAISSAWLNFFFSETLHDNLPVLRAKQLGRSMKKPTSCNPCKHQPKTIENLCQVFLSGVSLEDLFLLSYENATVSIAMNFQSYMRKLRRKISISHIRRT